ncbi:hypothetical protein CERSUDRAFT_136342 [Gelatoporia subvermispora B]|uniref:pH-response regulator protein palC n=1 Tax=Ceriporiopsis subvermispora (strain B) TaxID=914234 RepID=M2QKT7_CERS8|nr:hypothetical protein CERSUDRAFT_136342 [Gelatoporia subvermispora B]
MSTYQYELPTTGAVSFAEFLQDDSATYISEIAECTEARANLRAILKESKRTDDGEKDYLKLVKALDDYIPRLFSVVACLDHGDLRLKAEPVFSWRTTLSSTLFHTSPRLSIPLLVTELTFALLTYAFALSNLARAIVYSLGSYEKQRSITDAERRVKDERLGFAVTLLCRTAGIFEYIGKDCLALWERERDRVVSSGLNCPRPPDLSREVVMGLSKMALADAQSLAIRKLVSKAAVESTLNPGPPLPKSHPSPALVAKLHLECASLYSTARSLVKTPGATRTPSKSRNFLHLGKGKGKDKMQEETGEEVTPELRHYLSDEAAFHAALAKQWLGVDTGEIGGTEKMGIAVGFIAWAKKELEDLRSGSAVIESDREKEMRERRRLKVAEELENASVFLKGYTRINDTLACQPVPPQADLQASIPAGRLAVVVKPYTPPIPAFGPGSVNHLGQQAEGLEIDTQATGATDGTFSPQSQKSYAGAGSYF